MDRQGEGTVGEGVSGDIAGTHHRGREPRRLGGNRHEGGARGSEGLNAWEGLLEGGGASGEGGWWVELFRGGTLWTV